MGAVIGASIAASVGALVGGAVVGATVGASILSGGRSSEGSCVWERHCIGRNPSPETRTLHCAWTGKLKPGSAAGDENLPRSAIISGGRSAVHLRTVPCTSKHSVKCSKALRLSDLNPFSEHVVWEHVLHECKQ